MKEHNFLDSLEESPLTNTSSITSSSLRLDDKQVQSNSNSLSLISKITGNIDLNKNNNYIQHDNINDDEVDNDEQYYQKQQLKNDKLKPIRKSKRKQQQLSLKQQQQQQQLQILEQNERNRKLRCCLIKIEKPIQSSHFFQFSGHVIFELSDNHTYTCVNTTNAFIRQLQKRSNFITAIPSFSDMSQEYDKAIFMLEKKQNMFEYELSKLLIQYKFFVKDQEEKIQSIKNAYNNNYDILYDLQQQRGQFRNETINMFIKMNMKDDDFYLCHDIGINFEQNWTSPLFFIMSNNLFALFGVEDDHVHIFMTKKEAFATMIPHESRKVLTYLKLKFLLKEQDDNSKIEWDGFQLNTLDNIQIFCGLEAFTYDVHYPPHLQYLGIKNDSQQDMEKVQFIKLNITMNHLQFVISQRCNNQIIPQVEDIEYSIFSQIFIEKYYSEELKLLNKEVNDEYQNEQNNNKIIEQNLDHFTCGYRYV